MPLAISLPTSSFSHFTPRRRHGHAILRYKRFPGARSSLEEPYDKKNQTGVIIIGAGLAGLAAATRLNSERIPFLLLEASDAVGGRVRTDIVDGFFLDRGFQIFITAYPEAKKLLDYEALDLQRFYAGAKVFYGGKFHTVADPLRHFWDSVASITNPIGSVVDKGLIALTRARVLIKSDEEILTAADEVTTIDLLRKIGFSEAILDRFFRPFFGGIFFDRDLETTSKLFDFIFRCLALGENTLPAMGIGEIPNQLAAKLPASSFLFNTRVASIEYPNGSDSDLDPPSVRLQDGGVLKAELGVIVAVEQHEADKLLEGIREPVTIKPARSTICVYFTAEPSQIPVQDPVLFLNGSSTGIINNMFFATNVARTYAPPGKALVSVSLIGSFEDRSDDDLAAEVLRELSGWFNEYSVMSWKHLKTYRIKFAQPNQCPPTDLVKSPRVGSGLYLCGDYMTSATFDGALVSGRRAVEVLLREKGQI
ncbi:PREDICTED: 15-cis-phytoene desaturase, chloroplastic/chromoplastic-like [Camelina sativa]|uniref:15-cis-phytoene desaturase, chloroplastic/chromoplastic-like n=1 Tax=Camelina sativa TaxID=90675 RepID=A0ABM0W238_CAMSA|nr:PREDICTED: 15-cis-phytoene desaturase, chloroplastic/chromoplastic-like [Camelina sativa]